MEASLASSAHSPNQDLEVTLREEFETIVTQEEFTSLFSQVKREEKVRDPTQILNQYALNDGPFPGKLG